MIESSLDRARDRNIFISFISSLFSVLFAITRLTAAGFSSVTRSVLGFLLSLLNDVLSSFRLVYCKNPDDAHSCENV